MNAHYWMLSILFPGMTLKENVWGRSLGVEREAGVGRIGYTVFNIWACRIPCVRTCLLCHLITQSKQSDLPPATSPLPWVLIVAHRMDAFSWLRHCHNWKFWKPIFKFSHYCRCCCQSAELCYLKVELYADEMLTRGGGNIRWQHVFDFVYWVWGDKGRYMIP